MRKMISIRYSEYVGVCDSCKAFSAEGGREGRREGRAIKHVALIKLYVVG